MFRSDIALFYGHVYFVASLLTIDTTRLFTYNLAKLAKLETSHMNTKTIASTEAQNNFGLILNDVIQNNTRYVIKRRNAPQAIILSLSDFEKLLNEPGEQMEMTKIVRELTPVYSLGETVEVGDIHSD